MKSRAEILNAFVETNILPDLERFPEIVSDALRKDGDVIRSGVVRALPQLAVNAFLAKVAPRLAASPAYVALTRAEGCAITAGEYGDFQAAMHEDAESGGAA
jgi:hypothetical protein